MRLVVGFSSRGLVAAWLVGSLGCFQSTGDGDELTACTLPELLTSDGECTAVGNALVRTAPQGLCRDESGGLVAVTSLPLGTCRVEDGVIELQVDACSTGDPSSPLEAVPCDGDAGAGPLAYRDRAGNVRPAAFDPPPGGCAPREDAPPDTLGEPEAGEGIDRLCVRPATTCGAPFRFDVVGSEPDPCSGGFWQERCDATLAGDVIEVELGARRFFGGCRAAIGVRSATCLLPSAPPGRYPVVRADDGEVLGRLDVRAAPRAPSEGELERYEACRR